MFEIRARMARDVRDLRQHVDPKVVGKQVSTKLRDRVRGPHPRGAEPDRLGQAPGQRRRRGRRKRNPSAITDAVKSDPRPLILLAIALAATLMAARKISNGREE